MGNFAPIVHICAEIPLKYNNFVMKKSFSPYLIGYAVILVAMVSLLINYPKRELHIMLNSCHTALGDTFFYYYSKLAEWPIYVLGALPLLFKKIRWWTVVYLASELSAVVPIQILKRSFDMPRPALFFGEDQIGNLVPLVDGVHLHLRHSFPSGHTSAFFVFFTTCALLLTFYMTRRAVAPTASRKALHALMLVGLMLMAAVGGFSRIYLSQHFMLDVCVGSIVGVTMPCVMFWVLSRYTRLIPND